MKEKIEVLEKGAQRLALSLQDVVDSWYCRGMVVLSNRVDNKVDDRKSNDLHMPIALLLESREIVDFNSKSENVNGLVMYMSPDTTNSTFP